MGVGNFFADKYIHDRDLVLLDGRRIQLGKGTGTMIGTETTQKLGFFGTAPVSQLSDPGDASGCTGNADTVVNNLVTQLHNIGLVSTS